MKKTITVYRYFFNDGYHCENMGKMNKVEFYHACAKHNGLFSVSTYKIAR